MENSVNVTLLVISAVILINVIMSIVVLRAASYSPKQRVLQLALIWVIPLVGAGICAAFASFQTDGRQLASGEDPFGSGADYGDSVCGCTSGGGTDGGGGGDGGGD